MQQIFPAQGPSVRAEIPGSATAASPAADFLADRYAYPEPAEAARPAVEGRRGWVRANMVSSVDGAVSVDGRSGGLSGAADKLLFHVLRSLADVILVGAGTAREEKYKPARPDRMRAALRAGRTATPPIAVVTARLSLDPRDPLLTRAPADARTIVITTESAPADLRAAVARSAEVIVAGDTQVSAGVAIAALADRGYLRVLAEGGPSLLTQIAAAGLLDELCLTISPLLAGGPAGRILGGRPDPSAAPGLPESLQLTHVIADDGYLLCRYQRASQDARGPR